MSKPRPRRGMKIGLNPFERLCLDRDVLRDQVLDLRRRNAALVLQLARKQADEDVTVPFDARSEDGITTNLLDALQAIAAVLKDRSTAHPHCREAMADLGSNVDFGNLFYSALSASRRADRSQTSDEQYL
jgi:hypothetical protein